jgi:hypothetical protein
MSQPFFPTIGSVAAKANEFDDDTNPDTQQTDAEDKPLEEIESLCMKCGEQVSVCHLGDCTSYRCLIIGYDPDALDIHSILP